MLRNKIFAGLLLAGLSISANATVIEITEDFNNGYFDTENFEFNQTFQNNGNLMFENQAMTVYGRGAFSTVRDDLFGSEDNPLFISAKLTMKPYVGDIAFLAFRSDGMPNMFYNNEPNKGVLLRAHNFGSGQTDVMFNAVGNAADGTEYEFTNNYPPGGANFYNGTVTVEVTDFGSYADYKITNYNYGFPQEFTFTQTGLDDSTRGGHVVFSANGSTWDDIVITQARSNAVAEVSEPAIASIFALGLGGLLFGRRKRT